MESWFAYHDKTATNDYFHYSSAGCFLNLSIIQKKISIIISQSPWRHVVLFQNPTRYSFYYEGKKEQLYYLALFHNCVSGEV